VAAHKFLPDVAPAPLFLKKRQLAVRVAAVLKETSMSKPDWLQFHDRLLSRADCGASRGLVLPAAKPAQSY